MSWLTILLIALGLAMDAFAVSVSCGFAFPRREHKGALRIAFSFGLFQAGMPLLGGLLGLSLRAFIQSWDHWAAFLLLAGIGIHMIVEAVRSHREAIPFTPPGLLALLGLSVATSLDALAVGFSLTLLHVRIVAPAVMIGVVTFLISFLGIVLGHEMKAVLRGHGQRNIQIMGGLILIGIGIKILIQHLGM
jgi:manganese efflux pump family protein